MNIVILTYIFYPEPIVMSTITEDLAMALSEEHSVTVVTSRPCRPYGYSIPANISKDSWTFNRVIIDSYTHPKSDIIGRLVENVSFGRAAVKYIRENRESIDVIYLNVFPLFAQRMVIKEASKYGIPTVNHVEDIFPEPFKQKLGLVGNLLYKLLLPLDRWNINHASVTVVIGKQIKEYIKKTRRISGANISVVYNWQDESRFEQAVPQINSNLFTFMYVGSLSRAADIYNVVDGFIQADLECAQLILAGSGTEKENLIEYIKDFNNIKIIDAPFADIPKIQSQADVLILPLLPDVSLRAVPSKLPAYLFSKKPVIACVDQGSDVHHILSEADCGWIAPPRSPSELANVMLNVHKYHKDRLNEMGLSGYSYAKEHLVKKTNLEKLVDAIVTIK